MSVGETEQKSCVVLSLHMLHFPTWKQFASADVGMCKQMLVKRDSRVGVDGLLGRLRSRQWHDGLLDQTRT